MEATSTDAGSSGPAHEMSSEAASERNESLAPWLPRPLVQAVRHAHESRALTALASLNR
jgi:hypothetical protein